MPARSANHAGRPEGLANVGGGLRRDDPHVNRILEKPILRSCTRFAIEGLHDGSPHPARSVAEKKNPCYEDEYHERDEEGGEIRECETGKAESSDERDRDDGPGWNNRVGSRTSKGIDLAQGRLGLLLGDPVVNWLYDRVFCSVVWCATVVAWHVYPLGFPYGKSIDFLCGKQGLVRANTTKG